MRPLVVMFDLEGTLINSWQGKSNLPSKIKFIKDKLNCFLTPSDFGIFSFAIDHEHEKPEAIIMAEGAINRPINPNLVPCFKELENIYRFQTDSLQKWEIVNLLGKDLLFPMWALQFPDKDFILFDDALPQKHIVLIREIDKDNIQVIDMWRV